MKLYKIDYSLIANKQLGEETSNKQLEFEVSYSQSAQ